MPKYIKNKGKLIAIIISENLTEPGIKFLTENELSQQLAHMCHPAGKIIEPHVHCPIERQIHYTQEALFLRKGKLEVDFYDENKNYLSTHLLIPGDVILLVSGGHGFKVIEEIDMVEVKQGPYVEGKDKIRFKSTKNENKRKNK